MLRKINEFRFDVSDQGVTYIGFQVGMRESILDRDPLLGIERLHHC
jgi:hypothetical protein